MYAWQRLADSLAAVSSTKEFFYQAKHNFRRRLGWERRQW